MATKNSAKKFNKDMAIKIGRVSKLLLIALLETGQGFLDGCYDAVAHPHMNFSKYNGSYQAFYKSARRLQDQGLINLKKQGVKTEISFTEQGITLAQSILVLDTKIGRSKIWDRKWRVIIFDIPEKHKLVREVLREKLRFLGFVQLQKSVFVIPWPCEEIIRKIQDIYEAQKFIKYLEVVSFDGDGGMEKRFGL